MLFLGLLLIFIGLVFISLALLGFKGETRFFGVALLGPFPIISDNPKQFVLLVGAVMVVWMLLLWWAMH